MNKTQEQLIRGLITWCEDQRDSMIRQNELMQSGKMHVGSSDGLRMIDETPQRIEENKRHIVELETLLADITTGKV